MMEELNYSLPHPGFTQSGDEDYGFIQLDDNDLCFMDDQTIRCLELLENNINPSSKKHTLFGYLNTNSSTTIGERLLREAITRPLCHLSTIENRLDCIEYLVERVDTLAMICASIKKFGSGIDLDNLSNCVINLCKARNQTLQLAEKRLDAITIIERLVSQVDNMAAILRDNDQTTLNLCRVGFDDPAFKEIQQEIDSFLDPEVKSVKGKRAKIFRIKNGVDSLFDIARSTYFAALNDIEAYVSELRKETGAPWKSSINETRGFYLILQADKLPKKLLMSGQYLNVNKTRYHVTCTTRELMQMNVRANVSYENSMKLANEILMNALSSIMRHVASITKLIELIGMLDLTSSFAKLVSTSNGKLVRPKFTPDDTIIEAGRHPVMESILENNKLNYVENDTKLKTKTSNFMLVTGPNMGGKTIYLKQVALIQVMAQVGCYVPAKSAHIKLMNRIVARSGMNNDNLSNCSSFMWEMKGIASVFTLDKSRMYDSVLYLIDEFGRGTSIDCGTSYSLAISEELCLRPNCFTLFATHFSQVYSLGCAYKNMIPYHFEYEIKQERNGTTSSLITNHKLVSGEAERDHYGIKLAESCGLPIEIIKLACEGVAEYSLDKM